MQITAYEQIGTQHPAELDFDSFEATGVSYPQLAVRLKARTYTKENPQDRYTVQPTRLIAQLYLGKEPHTVNLIARGEGEHPLSRWTHDYSETVVVTFPLTPLAVQRIGDSLQEDYVPAVLELTGTATFEKAGQSLPFQFQKGRLEIRPSKFDWIKKVLEPIGMDRYYLLNVPIPENALEGYDQVFEELRSADEAFLVGDDPAVFLHAYNAWDTNFYSQRNELVSKLAVDEDKQGALLDLVKLVHRFANGGRHLPEERSTRGGFEVDHIDAEYIRGLSALSVAYLVKRLQSRASLS